MLLIGFKEQIIFYTEMWPNLKGKIKTLALALFGAIIIGSFLNYYLRIEEEATIRIIKASPVYTFGILVAKKPHKRKSFIVDFKAENRTFRFVAKVNAEMYNKYNLRDTVAIVYAKNDPSKAILRAE